MIRFLRSSLWLILLKSAAPAFAQWTPRNPVVSFEKRAGSVLFQMQAGTLKLEVCLPSVIHVLYSPTATFPERPDYMFEPLQFDAT